MIMYPQTFSSSNTSSEIFKLSMLPIAFLNLLIKLFSFLLSLMIVYCLLWTNSSLMIMLTIKKAWFKGLHRSGKIKWLLISIELSCKNIRLITELDLFRLSVY